MTLHRCCLLALLLAALSLSRASADTGVFVRFKLLEPTETSYCIQIGGYIYVEPWTLSGAVWLAGADSDRAKRVGGGTFTDWFDLGKYAGPKLHGQLHRAGGVAEFPNITANFVTGTDSPTRKVVIELATAPDKRAVVKRFDESFTGSLTSFLVSPRLAAEKDSLETASEMTRRRLTWAREASGGTRVSPSQLVVQTSFWSPQRPELNLQEAEVLWLLGFNIVDRWPEVRVKYDFAEPGGHLWAKFDPNLTREDIDSQVRPAAQATRASPRPTLFNFSDEIMAPAIGNDAATLRQFHGWLQAQNVRPADLGVKALDDVVPIESPDVLRQRQQAREKMYRVTSAVPRSPDFVDM